MLLELSLLLDEVAFLVRTKLSMRRIRTLMMLARMRIRNSGTCFVKLVMMKIKLASQDCRMTRVVRPRRRYVATWSITGLFEHGAGTACVDGALPVHIGQKRQRKNSLGAAVYRRSAWITASWALLLTMKALTLTRF